MSHQKSVLVSWIVAWKIVKSAGLAMIGVALLGSLHRDPVEVVVWAANAVNLSSTSRLFGRAVTMAMGLTVRRQIALAVTALAYSVLLGIEGIGLAQRRGWARWFTIGITSSLLPFEIYELIQRPGEPVRILTFLVNIGVVIYLYRKREAFEP